MASNRGATVPFQFLDPEKNHAHAFLAYCCSLNFSNAMNSVEQRFECVVQQILEQGKAVVEGLFPDQILSHLLLRITDLNESDALRPGAVGASGQSEVHMEIRSDSICWWPDVPTHPAECAYLEHIDALSAYLNRTCFTGIKTREFMYASYPPGASYARHVDDFRNKDARKFSVITYLNRDWTSDAGGELVTYGNNGPEFIAPTFGKTVIFSSPELEHEVRTTHRTRLSVTGWLR